MLAATFTTEQDKQGRFLFHCDNRAEANRLAYASATRAVMQGIICTITYDDSAHVITVDAPNLTGTAFQY